MNLKFVIQYLNQSGLNIIKTIINITLTSLDFKLCTLWQNLKFEVEVLDFSQCTLTSTCSQPPPAGASSWCCCHSLIHIEMPMAEWDVDGEPMEWRWRWRGDGDGDQGECKRRRPRRHNNKAAKRPISHNKEAAPCLLQIPNPPGNSIMQMNGYGTDWLTGCLCVCPARCHYNVNPTKVHSANLMRAWTRGRLHLLQTLLHIHVYIRGSTSSHRSGTNSLFTQYFSFM